MRIAGAILLAVLVLVGVSFLAANVASSSPTGPLARHLDVAAPGKATPGRIFHGRGGGSPLIPEKPGWLRGKPLMTTLVGVV